MDIFGNGARQGGSEHNGGEETSKRRTGLKVKNRARVLAHVKSVKYATIQDVANALDMSYTGAAAHLLALSQEGVIKKVRGNSFGGILFDSGTAKSIYIALEESDIPCVE